MRHFESLEKRMFFVENQTNGTVNMFVLYAKVCKKEERRENGTGLKEIVENKEGAVQKRTKRLFLITFTKVGPWTRTRLIGLTLTGFQPFHTHPYQTILNHT